MGRPPMGERALTAAEKQRRYRARKFGNSAPVTKPDREEAWAREILPIAEREVEALHQHIEQAHDRIAERDLHIAKLKEAFDQAKARIAEFEKTAARPPNGQLILDLERENSELRGELALEHKRHAAGTKPKAEKPPLPPDEVRDRQIKALRTEVRNLKAERRLMTELHAESLLKAGALDRRARGKIMFVLHPDQRGNATEADKDEACKLFTPLMNTDKTRRRST